MTKEKSLPTSLYKREELIGIAAVAKTFLSSRLHLHNPY
jgi:hypothetical protein